MGENDCFEKFRQIDIDNSGFVLFDEFCIW